MADPNFETLHRDITRLIQTIQRASGSPGGLFGGRRQRANIEPGDDEGSRAYIDRRERRDNLAATRDFRRSLEQSGTLLERMAARARGNATQLHDFQIRNFEDVKRAQALASEENMDSIRTIKRLYDNGNESYSESVNKLKQLGASADLLTTSLEDVEEIMRRYNEQTVYASLRNRRNWMESARQRMQDTIISRAVNSAMSSVAAASNSVAFSFGVLQMAMGPLAVVGGAVKIALSMVVKAAMAFVKGIHTVLETSRTAGMRISEQAYIQGHRMGMMGAELMHHMATYRQTLEAGGISVEGWSTAMADTSAEMYKYGMTIQEGGQFFSKTAKVFGELAGEAVNLAKGSAFSQFRDSQTELFKVLKTSVGMTEEAFSSMTNTLAQSEGVRTNLFKLDQRQRMAKFKELQLLTATLHVQGMSLEGATAFAEKLADLSGSDTKSRIEQAARVEATFGAVGLSEVGRQVGEEIRRGSRGDSNVIADGMKQFRDATGDMQRSLDEGMQMAGDKLTEASGLGAIMKSVETAILNNGNAVAQSLSELQRSTEESQLTEDTESAKDLSEGMRRLDQLKFLADNATQIITEMTAAALLTSGGLETLGDKVGDAIDVTTAAIEKAGGWSSKDGKTLINSMLTADDYASGSNNDRIRIATEQTAALEAKIKQLEKEERDARIRADRVGMGRQGVHDTPKMKADAEARVREAEARTEAAEKQLAELTATMKELVALQQESIITQKHIKDNTNPSNLTTGLN